MAAAAMQGVREDVVEGPAAGGPSDVELEQELKADSVTGHALYGYLRNYMTKHDYPSVENGVLKGRLNPDFFSNFILLPPNPTLLKVPVVEDFYWRSTFLVIWDPNVFWHKFCPEGKMPCPRCKSSRNVGTEGWESSLRRVQGIACTYLILTKRFRCKDCGVAKKEGVAETTSFNGLNRLSLEQLPKFILQELPFRLTHRGALHQPLVDLTERDVLNGKSFLDMHDMLEELSYLQYYRDHRQSLFYEEAKADQLKKGGMQQFVAQTPLAPFSKYSDQNGYRGKVVSGKYLSTVYKQECNESQEYLVKLLCMFTGKKLSADHTFTLTNYIRSGGQKVFEALHTFMNEHSQICSSLFVESTKNEDCLAQLQRMVVRCQELGIQIPETLYLDNPDIVGASYLAALHPHIKYLKLDFWHFQGRMKKLLHETHSLTGPLLRALTAAMYELNRGDVLELRQYLRSERKMTEKEIAALGEGFFLKNCRRSARSRWEQAERFEKVMRFFQETADIEDGVQLFRGTTKDQEAGIQRGLALIHDDFLTYPPGPMYKVVSKPGAKRIIYHSTRGTNDTESYHSKVHRVLSGSNNGTDLSGKMNPRFNYRYSVDAGIRNKGEPDLHTYKKGRRVIEDIQASSAILRKPNPIPEWVPLPKSFEPKGIFGTERLPKVEEQDVPLQPFSVQDFGLPAEAEGRYPDTKELLREQPLSTEQPLPLGADPGHVEGPSCMPAQPGLPSDAQSPPPDATCQHLPVSAVKNGLPAPTGSSCLTEEQRARIAANKEAAFHRLRGSSSGFRVPADGGFTSGATAEPQGAIHVQAEGGVQLFPSSDRGFSFGGPQTPPSNTEARVFVRKRRKISAFAIKKQPVSATRFSLPRVTRGVQTEAERRLFFQLCPVKGSINWATFTREYNFRVSEALKPNQGSTNFSLTDLALKQTKHLVRFARDLIQQQIIEASLGYSADASTRFQVLQASLHGQEATPMPPPQPLLSSPIMPSPPLNSSTPFHTFTPPSVNQMPPLPQSPLHPSFTHHVRHQTASTVEKRPFSFLQGLGMGSIPQKKAKNRGAKGIPRRCGVCGVLKAGTGHVNGRPCPNAGSAGMLK